MDDMGRQPGEDRLRPKTRRRSHNERKLAEDLPWVIPLAPRLPVPFDARASHTPLNVRLLFVTQGRREAKTETVFLPFPSQAETSHETAARRNETTKLKEIWSRNACPVQFVPFPRPASRVSFCSEVSGASYGKGYARASEGLSHTCYLNCVGIYKANIIRLPSVPQQLVWPNG